MRGDKKKGPLKKGFDPSQLEEGSIVSVNGEDEDIYIAEVLEFESKGGPQVKLRWFYKPEDVVYGRQVWHGSKELFKQTQVSDWNSVHSVTGFCKVHTLEEYQDLDLVEEDDYFCRQAYKPNSGEFVPDIVPVFCVCETPYNPDRPMVECEDCSDWFHWSCVGVRSKDTRRRGYTYTCTSCLMKKASPDTSEI
ncbi:BAH domain-containing protein [Chloropicon primus]|uniref:BAH domain-containing protein n=1 Tax=Chloropicon primus TaxID=1764295 RepID=A0A5B8MKH3_9CHLO|nr:BAH domain-containing protein [Chloropicon primus]UPQ99973.1 BAH domain-containing protein [Chloropicon primus]|mmetsp:Transcript_5481/g.16644  ORF Transcript_5481/g.16644 Transcript_5481/m.16644 type:complete len:193 (+) Transcript_5481:160-738(+)|eukprot:QDZ20761.1 BAH domain-containing protein [Chloropicon primus]